MTMDRNIRTLSSQSCVVKVNFPNSDLNGSSCGTIINPCPGLVISHGSILTEYLAANKKLLSAIKTGKVITKSDLPRADFGVLLSKPLQSSEVSHITKLHNSPVSDKTLSHPHYQKDHICGSYTEVTCSFLGAFRNQDFHNSLVDLMPSSSWAVADNLSENERDNYLDDQSQKRDVDGDVAYQLLSYFLLLKFNQSDSNIQEDLAHLGRISASDQWRPSNLCCIGDTAEIVATPFAALCPTVFFNGYSRGVISNISGARNCWILTDARCIPGCEGGPLFTKRRPADEKSFLTGVIASALCWKSNEWIGFSVACSINSILNSLAQLKNNLPGNFFKGNLLPTVKSNHHAVSKNEVIGQALTVLVQCGSTWGTGTVIDRNLGVILTCSHVLKDADSNKVTVTPSKSESSYSGEVVYRQDPVTGPYDLAVIKCLQATRHLPQGWTVQLSPAAIGDDVIVSGHAVFNTDHHLDPSVCVGVVSKVIRRQNKPVMIQTTCAVHAGVSGGPVLTMEGHLLGIAVCNTRDSSNNTSFPHVNLCVPITSVWPTVRNYLISGDKQSLSDLQVQDSELKQLWALGAKTNCDRRRSERYSLAQTLPDQWPSSIKCIMERYSWDHLLS